MKRRDAIALLAMAGTVAPFNRLRAASSDASRYGLSAAARPEVNAAALQRCLDDNAGGTVTIPGSDGEYPLAGRITVGAHTQLMLGDGT